MPLLLAKPLANVMQNTSQKNSANVTFTSGKCPLEAQFRNTRTPAGFEPKACKTQARKTLRTLPLESIKHNNSIAREMPLQLAKPLANVPSLGGTVPKHLNASRIPAQGMQNTSQKNSANVTFTSGKCPLEAQFRNTRTPAGFEPKACKTQARKTLRTLPLESIKNNNSIAREMPLQLAKPLANVPWRHSSETLERQQDSSPRHAKHKPEKLCERYLYQWQMSLGGTVPKHSNTSRIRAQGMQNTSQKNSPNVTFGIHIKQQFYRPWDASPASKTIGKCPLEAQFRNTWTPAGFQPKACKTQARKTLRTLPLESIKNNYFIAREMPLQLAKPLANVPWRHSSETLERQQDSSPRHAKHKPEKLCERYLYQWQMSLGGTVPKHSNTSRIRAQGMQNTSQKNSPNVTFGIHKKQQFYRPWDASPASKTIGKCPLEAQFRNIWTPAGFQPKACKTQARKTLRTLPLPVANVPWRHSSETLEHQQDSSPRHAKHKPEKLSERYLWNP